MTTLASRARAAWGHCRHCSRHYYYRHPSCRSCHPPCRRRPAARRPHRPPHCPRCTPSQLGRGRGPHGRALQTPHRRWHLFVRETWWWRGRAVCVLAHHDHQPHVVGWLRVFSNLGPPAANVRSSCAPSHAGLDGGPHAYRLQPLPGVLCVSVCCVGAQLCRTFSLSRQP